MIIVLLLGGTDESALPTIATNGPPRIDQTTEALNAIVAALHAAAAKADDVQLEAVNDAYADHVVQVMAAVSLRKLNRLLGHFRPAASLDFHRGDHKLGQRHGAPPRSARC